MSSQAATRRSQLPLNNGRTRLPLNNEVIDRMIRLRGALEGLATDNAALRRQLAASRAEARRLRERLDHVPAGDSRDSQMRAHVAPREH